MIREIKSAHHRHMMSAVATIGYCDLLRIRHSKVKVLPSASLSGLVSFNYKKIHCGS